MSLLDTLGSSILTPATDAVKAAVMPAVDEAKAELTTAFEVVIGLELLIIAGLVVACVYFARRHA